MTQRLSARHLPKDNARGCRTARAVLHRDGHYLLAMHIGAWGRQRRRWGLPGGAIEYGESPEVAVRRELQEELYQCPGDLLEIGDYHLSIQEEVSDVERKARLLERRVLGREFLLEGLESGKPIEATAEWVAERKAKLRKRVESRSSNERPK